MKRKLMRLRIEDTNRGQRPATRREALEVSGLTYREIRKVLYPYGTDESVFDIFHTGDAEVAFSISQGGYNFRLVAEKVFPEKPESKIRLKETKFSEEALMSPIERETRLKINSKFGLDLQQNYITSCGMAKILHIVVGYERSFSSKEEIIETVMEWLGQNAFLDHDDYYIFVVDGVAHTIGGSGLRRLQEGKFKTE